MPQRWWTHMELAWRRSGAFCREGGEPAWMLRVSVPNWPAMPLLCAILCYVLWNNPGDLSECGKLFRVSLSQFESDVLPHLTSHDCILCIHGNTTETQLQSLMNRLKMQQVAYLARWSCHFVRSNNFHRVLDGPAKCGLLVVAEENQSQTSFHHLLNCSR